MKLLYTMRTPIQIFPQITLEAHGTRGEMTREIVQPMNKNRLTRSYGFDQTQSGRWKYWCSMTSECACRGNRPRITIKAFIGNRYRSRRATREKPAEEEPEHFKAREFANRWIEFFWLTERSHTRIQFVNRSRKEESRNNEVAIGGWIEIPDYNTIEKQAKCQGL